MKKKYKQTYSNNRKKRSVLKLNLKTEFKYLDHQDSSIRKLVKNNEKWYLPDSGIWNETYMREKKNILTQERNKKEIQIIKKYIKGKDKKILDVPCGYGRISNLLSAMGYNVIGIDVNKNFINIAKTEAKKKKLGVKYLVADILNYKTKKKYDVVLNIFTSLGYFESEEKNELFINKLCQFVKPSGILVIEIINPFSVLKNYKDKEEMVAEGGIKILHKRFFDYRTFTNITEITEQHPDGKILQYVNRIRLYCPHELIRICHNYGLRNINILNSDGKKKDILDSLRNWFIFKKL